MAKMKLKHVYKKYEDGACAVEDFCLDIQDKEFVVFVGPSGCGKSTTLRMIAGLEKITEGELWIDDVLVNEVSASQRDMAMVFQNYALYPHMTVAENIGYSLKIAKIPKKEIEKQVSEVARLLDLEGVLDRRPAQLSGGQKQRVAMGRAIVRRPKAFLMDEPLSNLDAKLRKKMRTEIKKLHEMLQTTFIYVTHDQVEAMTLGTTIVVLKDGMIQQAASPRELYDKPANVFVAQFIGTPQMNLLDGSLYYKDRREYIKIENFMIPIDGGLADKISTSCGNRRDFIVGIRPEDIRLAEDGPFEAEVEVYELLGHESYIYFTFQEKKLCAKIRADVPVKVKDTIRFTLLYDKMHLFEPRKGERI